MGDDDPKGTYSRAPYFKGENYDYWKEKIYVHLKSFDKNILGINYQQAFYL